MTSDIVFSPFSQDPTGCLLDYFCFTHFYLLTDDVHHCVYLGSLYNVLFSFCVLLRRNTKINILSNFYVGSVVYFLSSCTGR